MNTSRSGGVARRRLAVAACGLVALLGAAAVGLSMGVAEPNAHDEFGYLLAADTFAHGRLANPPHPMWEHFETFHVLQQPTYAAKYPPAQGLFLMLGERIAGHPIAGVWITAAAMSGAVCWMLLAFFPVPWALLGGTLVALRFGSVGPWAQSSTGAALAAAGGAQVLGAVPRLVHAPRARDALLLGAGAALLANTRPFEGAVVALVAGAVLLVGWLRRGAPPRRQVQRALLALALVAAATLLWIGYYNLRVTGDALTFPYRVHHAAYCPVPLFLFQPVAEAPAYRHEIFREFYVDWALEYYRRARDPHALPAYLVERLYPLWKFYLGTVWTVPFVVLPWALRAPWMRFCLGAAALVLTSTFFSTFGSWPRYLAPGLAAGMALLVACLQQIDGLRWRGRRVGRALVGVFAIATLVALEPKLDNHVSPPDAWSRQRARLLAELSSTPESHLLIVRYAPGHSVHSEWVYNEADIDAARVVWAREMDPARDRALIDFFPGRRAWLLEVAPDRITLRAHPLAPATGAPTPPPLIRPSLEFN